MAVIIIFVFRSEELNGIYLQPLGVYRDEGSCEEGEMKHWMTLAELEAV